MQVIQNIQEAPVPDLMRRRTDNICTIWAILFSLTLFIYALAGFNSGNLMRTNFPSDSKGKLCGVDHSNDHYVYFPNPEDVNQRVCVKRCPASPADRIVCGEGCQSYKAYQTVETDTRYGSYCLPADKTLKDKVMTNAGLDRRQIFVDAYETVWNVFWGSLLLGLIYLVLTQCVPRIMSKVAIIGGAIALIVFGVYLFMHQSTIWPPFKLIWAVGLILLGLALIISYSFFRQQILLNEVFLYHSTRLTRTNFPMFYYIPVFILLAFLLLALTVFEFLAFWSIPDPVFNPNRPFYSVSGIGFVFLSLLALLQFVWGLAFLRQLFNFCISGNAVTWYFGRHACSSCFQPLIRGLRYHFGSIVAASFMIGFFGIPAFIVFLIKPLNPFSAYGRCYYSVFGWCDSLFDLVRSDAMAYINLSGLPYCNSARYCEFLCSNSRLFPGNQSISVLYRVGAHGLLVSIIGITALVLKPTLTIPALLFIIMLSLFLVTYFISFHSDASEGLLTMFLTEDYLTQTSLVKTNMWVGGAELLQDVRAVAVPPIPPGMAQTGYVQPGLVQPGLVQTVQPGLVQTVQPGLVQPGVLQSGYVQPGVLQSGYVQPGVVQQYV